MTNAKIEQLGWDRVDHPPYSRDLAPSNFHLFRSLERHLRGKNFDNFEQLSASIEEFFESKDSDFYRRGIIKLTEKWQDAIDYDGEYFD